MIRVGNAGYPGLGAALQAVTQLAQAGARIVGVVLNNIPTGRRSYYYYQYYQYYHYVPSSENGQREHQPAPATIRPTLLRNPFNEQGEQTAPVPDKATAAERATFARDDKRVT